MAKAKLPSYVLVKRSKATGAVSYYWNLPTWARAKDGKPVLKHGKPCPVQSTKLGSDLAEAIKKGDALNATLKEWRTGTDPRIAAGSVAWLFRWYRDQRRFKELRHKTRHEYRMQMDALCAIEMKVGTFGQRAAVKVNATVADKLYEKLLPRGTRQATYMMSTCRAVWNWAVRHQETTGIKSNPFAGMQLKTKAAKKTRAATRAEYTLYRETARAMGYQSMATAAALSFETCQRVWDVFGFIDPDKKVERGILWSGYKPGEEISLIQSKTGNHVTIPLYIDGPDGSRDLLYPELEEELARTTRRESDSIVVVERTGKPFSVGWMQRLHKKIRDKAGLPADLSFTCFRHGGLTEIGDSGEADVRAISGHTTLAVTAIYNKANAEKARRIAAKRREHVALIAGTLSENELENSQNGGSANDL